MRIKLLDLGHIRGILFEEPKYSFKPAATLSELAAACVMPVLVGQPLDTVKPRAQIAPESLMGETNDIRTIMIRAPEGRPDVATMRREGFLASYKDMADPLFGTPGVNLLLFAAYGALKSVISLFPQAPLKETSAADAMRCTGKLR
ncbi:hypothetical protein BD626DRAFT_539698 [Schizophyllum amplum]|uniref:Uncharacterized protein n=1 Tax=Schizophyllum amplum TaxID=97359 RepID=A0A550C240_9AGAR|nr:hypothetical protein BD626DRAFT_539698 [Auriculariopsis ampla]